MRGWVKWHREWLYNPIITKDTEHLAVWVYLISNAVHNEINCIFKGKKSKLKRGEILFNHKDIYESCKIEPSKLRRIFKSFKDDCLIDYQTDKHKTLITLTDWEAYQGLIDYQNDDVMTIKQLSKEETEKEKEKRSKREKGKEKEINKNNKNVISVYKEDDTQNILLGPFKNVLVSREWYEEFKSRYWYYESIVNKLSTYKKAHNISNKDDAPYLERFAIEDKDQYIKEENATFDADDFFEAALRRSYGDDYDRG